MSAILGGLGEVDLACLYEKYAYLVHRRCVAILQNRSDADDVLQEVFLRVQRFAKSQNSVTLQWLYTIAANCSFDFRRRNTREELRAQVPEPQPAWESDSDRRALLGEILSRFDSKTREIAILHHLDGFTQDEVAGRTGYSRKTIGKKLRAFEEAFQKLWLGANVEVNND